MGTIIHEIGGINSFRTLQLFDFNNDGNLDIIFGDRFNNIMWIENLTNNVFSDVDTLLKNSSMGASSMTVFDINNDGFGDLVYPYLSTSLLNDSTNNMISESFDIGEHPNWDDIYIKDINGDGFDDLYGIESFFNGIFQFVPSANSEPEIKSLFKSKNAVEFVYTGHFNNDDLLDLLVIERSADDENKITWYSNQGNGQFNIEKTLLSGEIDFSHSVVADIDLDGDDDIVNSAVNDQSIRLLINDGNGNFTIDSFLTKASGFRGLVYNDFDNIIVGLTQDNSVSDDFVIIDLTNIQTPSVEYFEGNNNLKLAIEMGDVNGDNIADILTTELMGSNSILTYYDGDDEEPKAIIIDSDFDLFDIPLVDIDNDGDLDIVNLKFFSNMEIIINEGQGIFSRFETNISPSSGYVGKGDMDNDGSVDLILGNPFGEETYIIYNKGNLEFEQILVPQAERVSEIIPIDFENDGDMDLILTNTVLDELSLIKNQLITSTRKKQRPQTRVKILPNPTHDNITLTIAKYISNGVINIYSVTGRLINSYTYQPEMNINLSTYTSGIYFAKIVDQKDGSIYVSPKILKID